MMPHHTATHSKATSLKKRVSESVKCIASFGGILLTLFLWFAWTWFFLSIIPILFYYSPLLEVVWRDMGQKCETKPSKIQACRPLLWALLLKLLIPFLFDVTPAYILKKRWALQSQHPCQAFPFSVISHSRLKLFTLLWQEEVPS